MIVVIIYVVHNDCQVFVLVPTSSI